MNALILGGGSKWGEEFTKLLVTKGYHCYLVTSSKLSVAGITTIDVDWLNLTLDNVDRILEQIPDVDLVFFNQNCWGGPNTEDFSLDNGFNKHTLAQWTNSYWIDCQLPVYIIKQLKHRIKPTTKVGWMMTGFIKQPLTDQNWKYAGYGSKKFTNLAIMRGFSMYRDGIFFAVNPWGIDENNRRDHANKVFKIIENLDVSSSGKSFQLDGTEWW